MKSLVEVGMLFLADLLSTLVFALTFAVTKNIYAATAAGIGVGLGQFILMKVRGSKIDLMQAVSLGLVVVLGAATIVTHDPTFIILKPTFIYAVVGLVMLKPNWMGRYMPPIVNDNAPGVPWAFGYVWALLMFVTAIANAIIGSRFDIDTYVKFLAIFPLVSKLLLFSFQFLATRVLVRRRLKKRASAANVPQGIV